MTLTTLFTFTTVQGGLLDDVYATTEEAEVNKLEEQWLIDYGFLDPTKTINQARKEYESEDHDDDYYIHVHVLKIETKVEVANSELK